MGNYIEQVERAIVELQNELEPKIVEFETRYKVRIMATRKGERVLFGYIGNIPHEAPDVLKYGDVGTCDPNNKGVKFSYSEYVYPQS